VHSVETTPDGKNHITMDYIRGKPLSQVWKNLSADEKSGIARQLREFLVAMRAVPVPDTYIGDCAGNRIRDLRERLPYTAPTCRDERGFNDYLLSGLPKKTPPAIRHAFAASLRTDHRIVLTHADLAPRNIMVEDGKITGIVDWEEAGWYPEYWEYVKFFQRSTGVDGDWRDYADDIFPQAYPEELVDYIALSRWQYQ
jgi:aminoglycoside phosphotransferase (APT) family kinase protein